MILAYREYQKNVKCIMHNEVIKTKHKNTYKNNFYKLSIEK